VQDKLVISGFLRHSDQFCTDKTGNTLLMAAAHSGSMQSMKFLLSQVHCPLNAQNQKVVLICCMDMHLYKLLICNDELLKFSTRKRCTGQVLPSAKYRPTCLVVDAAL